MYSDFITKANFPAHYIPYISKKQEKGSITSFTSFVKAVIQNFCFAINVCFFPLEWLFLLLRIKRKKNQLYQLHKAATFTSLVLNVKLFLHLNLFLIDVELCYIPPVKFINFYRQVLLSTWTCRGIGSFCYKVMKNSPCLGSKLCIVTPPYRFKFLCITCKKLIMLLIIKM